MFTTVPRYIVYDFWSAGNDGDSAVVLLIVGVTAVLSTVGISATVAGPMLVIEIMFIDNEDEISSGRDISVESPNEPL